MSESVAPRVQPGHSTEFWSIMLFSWLAMAAIPLGLGKIGISWDALNHHIYLGWVASSPRFDLDFLAASYQSYQFPYLYWPVFQLSQSGLSGAWAGVVLASLHWLAVPPIWMIAKICIPGRDRFETAMRMIAVALAFSSGLVLSLFDTTANDLLASIPLIWAMAYAMKPLNGGGGGVGVGGARTAVFLSGMFAGLSIACKLSNGPLAILLPCFWLFSAARPRERVLNTVLGGVAMAIGFAAAYGYWGWQLWSYFGNPVYPFYDGAFEPLRTLTGWKRP